MVRAVTALKREARGMAAARRGVRGGQHGRTGVLREGAAPGGQPPHAREHVDDALHSCNLGELWDQLRQDVVDHL